jgi:hypothetical protein
VFLSCPSFGLLHSAQIQIFFPMKEAVVRTPYSGYGQALATLLSYSQTKCLSFSKIEIEKGWFLWNKRGIQYLERWQDSGEQGGWWPTFLKILLFNQSFLRLSNVVRTDDSQWSRIIYETAVNFMTYSKREEFKMFNDIIWSPLKQLKQYWKCF